MREPTLSGCIRRDPVRFARPKAVRLLKIESCKALDDEQVSAPVRIFAGEAREGIVGERNFAILLLFVKMGAVPQRCGLSLCADRMSR